MIIDKVINNNIISTFDESGNEVVVMGRGLGFQTKQGMVVNNDRIEKIFRIESSTLADQFKELLKNMPIEHVQISNDVIAYAKKNLDLKLNQSIYITLTDHINFAIERYNQGIPLTNALLWEIKRFYHREFLLGEYAVKMIYDRLHISLTEDEAGFVALHFVNAEYSTNLKDTFEITQMIQGVLQIVKNELSIEFDEQSLHYERFLTHLKFLAQRIYRHELLNNEEEELAEMMRTKYPTAYACSIKAAAYIEKEFGSKLSGEETMYLAIHISRVITREA